MNNLQENNRVKISGVIVSQCTYSHEIYGEKFFSFILEASRISGAVDMIPVTASERLLDTSQDMSGFKICVTGQFRSYNKRDADGTHTILSVFARELEFLDELQEGREDNLIELDGCICKRPVYRTTPLGREISDLLLAVNRSYGKTDYIPCICWGRNARFASGFEVGGRVQIWGRIQSREYVKKISETESERRVAYEVSVSKLEYAES